MILISLIALLGLIAGVIIAKFTKEELRSGKKYFTLFSKTMLFIITIYLLYLCDINWMLSGVLLGAILTLFIKNIYLYLGLAMFSSLNANLALFIFLFGLPHGTLIHSKKNLILTSSILFLITSLVLLINIPQTILLSISAGAIFSIFLKK